MLSGPVLLWRQICSIVLLFATIWTTDWTELNWLIGFVKMLVRGVPFVGKARGQILLLFVTIWTTDWLNWTDWTELIVGFVKILARGVPFVGEARKQIVLLFADIWTTEM